MWPTQTLACGRPSGRTSRAPHSALRHVLRRAPGAVPCPPQFGMSSRGSAAHAGRRQDNRAAERADRHMCTGVCFFADDEDEYGLEDVLQARALAHAAHARKQCVFYRLASNHRRQLLSAPHSATLLNPRSECSSWTCSHACISMMPNHERPSHSDGCERRWSMLPCGKRRMGAGQHFSAARTRWSNTRLPCECLYPNTKTHAKGVKGASHGRRAGRRCASARLAQPGYQQSPGRRTSPGAGRAALRATCRRPRGSTCRGWRPAAKAHAMATSTTVLKPGETLLLCCNVAAEPPDNAYVPRIVPKCRRQQLPRSSVGV